MHKEIILFEIHLLSECWDKLPHIKIYVDKTEHWNNFLSKGRHTIKFWHTCEFDQLHKLTIIRSGKDNRQVRTMADGKSLDQFVVLEKIIIDGIDIQNIILSKSIFQPEYPEPWASQQLASGHKLEKDVVGATTFGHNGDWYLNFTSPFYVHLMKWMGGGVFDDEL